MRILVRECILAVALLFASHGLAYFLLTVLPDASFSALGIFVGNQDVVAQWKIANSAQYGVRIWNLLDGDFGLTLDNIPVMTQVSNALLVSMPHLLLAVAFIAIALRYIGSRGTPLGHTETVANYINFLPPYIIIAIFVTASLLTGLATFALTIVAALALATPPLALLAAQTYRITTSNLRSDHALFHRALGATDFQVRQRLLKNLLLELLPSLHNATLALFSSLLFVEVMMGIGGIGSLTARAIKRVDINLVLGLIIVYASIGAIVRIVSRVVHARFPS